MQSSSSSSSNSGSSSASPASSAVSPTLNPPAESGHHPSNHNTQRSQSTALSMRSVKSVRASFVRFVNLTRRRVDVIWINYEGRSVKYKTLRPREYLDVNTYVSHPWIFRDSDTHDKLVISSTAGIHTGNENGIFGSPVFRPQETLAPDGRTPVRKVVYITLPVYTLKERCFQMLRKYFDNNLRRQNGLSATQHNDPSNRTCISEESLQQLEIPLSLKHEFRNYLQQLNYD